MHTLSITSTKQGITYNAVEAAASFAIVEKLSSLAGQLLNAARLASFGFGASLRTAQA